MIYFVLECNIDNEQVLPAGLKKVMQNIESHVLSLYKNLHS